MPIWNKSYHLNYLIHTVMFSENRICVMTLLFCIRKFKQLSLLITKLVRLCLGDKPPTSFFWLFLVALFIIYFGRYMVTGDLLHSPIVCSIKDYLLLFFSHQSLVHLTSHKRNIIHRSSITFVSLFLLFREKDEPHKVYLYIYVNI